MPASPNADRASSAPSIFDLGDVCEGDLGKIPFGVFSFNPMLCASLTPSRSRRSYCLLLNTSAGLPSAQNRADGSETDDNINILPLLKRMINNHIPVWIFKWVAG